MRALAFGAVILALFALPAAATARSSADSHRLTKRPPVVVAGGDSLRIVVAPPVLRSGCVDVLAPLPVRVTGKNRPAPRVVCRAAVLQAPAAARRQALRQSLIDATLARLEAEVQLLQQEVTSLRVELRHAKR